MNKAINASKIVLLLALFSALAGCSPMLKGYETGNGGGEEMLTFAKAREAAVDRLQLVKMCGTDPATSSDAKRWFVENLDRLADDIKYAAHEWTYDSLGSCAWTKPTLQSVVRLSYSACRGIQVESAMALLIHESVHHFGFADETFPNEIAQAAMKVSEANCAPDLNQIAWLDYGLGLDETIELKDVRITPPVREGGAVKSRGKICFEYSKVDWPTYHIEGSSPSDSFNTIGNYWIVAYINGKWTASTYDWIVPGIGCPLEDHSTIHQGAKKPALSGWIPRSGELVGFIVSTPVRFGWVENPRLERSNIKWVRWPKY